MNTTSSAPGGLRRVGSVYKRLLWGTMDAFGITDSLWRKMMVAVGLQFAAGIALATVVVVFEGATALAVAGGLLALAAIACFNTALIVREDLTQPLRELESSAETVAEGTLDVDSPTIEQDDEVGSLAASFGRMHETLRVTDRQAEALADESFDDPVLEESVPGEFGDSLDRMAENLSAAISDLEARSARLTRLIEEFEAASTRAADGDLTVRLPAEEIDDRFEGVVTSYNEQLDAFEAAIGRAKPFAGEVADASETARRELDAVSETSEANAAEVGEIADDAARQSETLGSLAGDAETLSATVEEIAAASNELSEVATRTATNADDGVDAVEEARTALHDAADIAAETDEAVARLVERTESIREIVSFIDEVASRTNLLAVNASIEAARADTDTAGFEVVAEEVKSLAEETHESAGEIEELIGDIDEETHAVAADVDDLTTRIDEAVATVDAATEAFTAIAEDTADVEESAAEISSATDQQAQVATDVSARVDELAEIGDATAERSDSVASDTVEGAARLREAADSVTSLAGQADRLSDALSAFEVGERGGAADAGSGLAPDSEGESDPGSDTEREADGTTAPEDASDAPEGEPIPGAPGAAD